MLSLLWIGPLAVYALFLLYVLAMTFKRAWPDMGRAARAVAAPVIVVAVVWDWLVNMTLASLVFWELPWTWGELVTARLKRYHFGVAYIGDWRRNAAAYICEHVLDVFDPDGDHC